SGAPSGAGSCLPVSCGGTTTIPFTVTNHGPATMLEPVLVINWTFHDANQASNFQADSGPCPTMQSDSTHYQTICEVAPFAAGATGTANVTFNWEAAASTSAATNETWTYTWSFAGGYGARSTPASGTGTVTICAPQGPGC